MLILVTEISLIDKC